MLARSLCVWAIRERLRLGSADLLWARSVFSVFGGWVVYSWCMKRSRDGRVISECHDVVMSRVSKDGRSPLVEVIWSDASDIGGDWVTADEAVIEPAVSLSVGYLIASNKNSVSLAALVNESHFAHGITIPRKMIVEIRTLS